MEGAALRNSQPSSTTMPAPGAFPERASTTCAPDGDREVQVHGAIRLSSARTTLMATHERLRGRSCRLVLHPRPGLGGRDLLGRSHESPKDPEQREEDPE